MLGVRRREPRDLGGLAPILRRNRPPAIGAKQVRVPQADAEQHVVADCVGDGAGTPRSLLRRQVIEPCGADVDVVEEPGDGHRARPNRKCSQADVHRAAVHRDDIPARVHERAAVF